MTICIYSNGTMIADSMITNGDIVESTNFKKVFKVYEDAITGDRSLDKTKLSYPKEFALVAVAGCIKLVSRFLRWFIHADHPFIDHEDHIKVEGEEPKEYTLQAIVAFKDKSIVRLYDNDYELDLYVDYEDYPGFHVSIGSGAIIADSVLMHDKSTDLRSAVECAIKLEIHCGGEPYQRSFGDESFDHTLEDLALALSLANFNLDTQIC